MLSQEQQEKLKEQIIEQINNSQLSEEQKSQAIEQVEDMNEHELEDFIKKNQPKSEKQECPFCLIIENKIPSYKLDENKSSIAVLEISPLSLGHTLVISKNHKKLPSSAFTLANKIAKKIKSKLKPEEIKIESSQIMGHNLVQLIPIYKDKKLERKKAEEKALILLQDKLQAKPKKKRIIKKQETTIENLPKYPRRMP